MHCFFDENENEHNNVEMKLRNWSIFILKLVYNVYRPTYSKLQHYSIFNIFSLSYVMHLMIIIIEYIK